MFLNGFVAEAHERSHLAGAETLGDQLQDLTLAAGQSGKHWLWRNAVESSLRPLMGQVLKDFRTKRTGATVDGADGLEQKPASGRVDEIAGRPGSEGGLNPQIITVGGKDHDSHERPGAQNLAGRLNAVEPRHGYIHQDDIGPE